MEIYCPHCGNEYLHQKEVAVTWRYQEDSGGVCYTTSRKKDFKEHLDSKHIPHRRDNLIIVFDCENCEGDKNLEIYQHKGVTYMEWLK